MSPAGAGQPPSLKRSFLYSAANLGLNLLFPLVSFAYVARVLGPEVLGRVSFAFAVSAMFLLLAAVALPIHGAKAVAQAREDRDSLSATFTELFLLNLAASAAWSLGFLAVLFAVPSMRADWLLFLIAGSSLAWNAAYVDWLFAGLEDFRALFVRGIILKCLSLLLLFLLVRERDDVLVFAAINVLAGGAANLWGLAAALRRTRFTRKGLRIARHLRPMAAMSGSSVASGIYTQVDNVLLGLLSGPQAVGLYSAAMKIPRLASIFLVSLGATSIPRLAHHAQGARADQAEAVREKALSLLLMLTLPGAAMTAVLAPQLLSAISGPEFAAASGALRLGALLAVPAVAANFLGMQVLLPGGREKALVLGSAAGAAFNLAANLLLIPVWGFMGSALAAVATETFVFGAFLIFVRGQRVVSRAVALPILRYFAAALACAATAYWTAAIFANPMQALMAALPAGGGLYFATLWISGDAAARDLLRFPLTRFRGVPSVHRDPPTG